MDGNDIDREERETERAGFMEDIINSGHLIGGVNGKSKSM